MTLLARFALHVVESYALSQYNLSPDIRAAVITTSEAPEEFGKNISSLSCLVRVTAWILCYERYEVQINMMHVHYILVV